MECTNPIYGCDFQFRPFNWVDSILYVHTVDFKDVATQKISSYRYKTSTYKH